MHKHKNRNKNIWLWTLPILWMGVIFAFSHQPGRDSAQLSGHITMYIEGLLRILGIDPSGMDLGFFIRKAAHFSIYFVLGILVFAANYANRGKIVESAVVAVLLSTGYAFLDEYHQSFIPGRSCQLTDVLIDSSGTFTGSAACLGLRSLKKHVRNNKNA